MFAQMRHMAIVTSNANNEGDFYRDVFGMRRSSLQRAGAAVVVGDGYIGLNLNPRAPGRQAGFDHFGFEVQDVEVVFSRLKEKYPKIQVLHRPSNRPFAGISMHDPMGNVFDLSQANMENRRDLYTDKVEERKRRIGHFGLRCVEPTQAAVGPPMLALRHRRSFRSHAKLAEPVPRVISDRSDLIPRIDPSERECRL